MEKEAIKIVKKLQSLGFESYFAGGFVRDKLLGIKSHDIDIVTSATPDEVEKAFDSTLPIGKQFGIILVNLETHSFHVATFRKEDGYLDQRHPTKVTFTSAEHDAQRRDFTINGIFFDPIKDKYFDFVNGLDDIKSKTIRFIGNPKERIQEDNLRVIRAVRLKVAFNFEYDKDTFLAIREKAQKIMNVSPERIRDELNKIMVSPNRHLGLVELSQSGILKYIIPELEKLKGVPQPIEYHHEGDVFTHTYLALKALPNDASEHLAWAVMLHDIAKPQTLIRKNGRIIFHDHAKISSQIARKILKRLKFPNFEIEDICWLVENHMKVGDINKMRPAKRLEFLLDLKFNDLLKLTKADSMGTYPINLSLVSKIEIEKKKALLWKKEKEQKSRLKFFSGDNLIELGFKPGKKFSEILDDLNDEIVEGNVRNKSEAIKFVTQKYKA
ncbi:MAG: CCA tRNA nucleotidyltransferase [Candidatus Berkelbacteria bacterium]|nr:CCA tRNA nucleotidyltransferase [Candidatus Berkelbacteria bacterium]